MRKKRNIILVVQVVLVLLSVFLLVRYTNSKIELTDVYVYSRDIDNVEDKISENDIEKVSIPKSAIGKDFALNKKDIIDKHVDGKVTKGQYVYNSQLIERDEIDVFETMDLSEYRKISLPISFVDSFSGNIKRGDTVDLVYTGEGVSLNEETLKDSEYKYSKVFMQDVVVYSVNTDDGFKFVDHSEYSPGALVGDEDEEVTIDDSEISTITLAVTLEQAEEIETRVSAGEVRFLGRFDDSQDQETFGYIMGQHGEIPTGKGHGEVDTELDSQIIRDAEEDVSNEDDNE